MSLTITLHLWWLWVYLGIGTVLFIPLNLLAYRNIVPPRGPFWRKILRKPWINLITIALWPAALWQAIT